MAERDAAGDDVVVRVLCPVDRIEAVSRLSVGGARIRFDCASASPFPSDRVVLISPLPLASDHSGSQSQSEEENLKAALLGVFERITLPSPLPPRLDFHHAACRPPPAACSSLPPRPSSAALPASMTPPLSSASSPGSTPSPPSPAPRTTSSRYSSYFFLFQFQFPFSIDEHDSMHSVPRSPAPSPPSSTPSSPSPPSSSPPTLPSSFLLTTYCFSPPPMAPTSLISNR